jgi:glucan phosphoethanolaminetransferase (alkaline phosphatase superfamily)
VQVFASAVTTMVVLLINIIATAVRVFGKFFDGFRTVTVFITNCLLVILVIERAITHAWVGMQQRHAKSCLNFQPITYNVIDRRLAERMRVKRDASENP